MSNKIYKYIIGFMFGLTIILMVLSIIRLRQLNSDISNTAQDIENLDNQIRAFQDKVNAKAKLESATIYMGKASYYSYRIGDYNSADHNVCASRDFPRGSMLLVTYIDQTSPAIPGYDNFTKTSICKVTDYGPDKSVFPDRVIDLSPKVFRDLAPLRQGILKDVTIQLIK